MNPADQPPAAAARMRGLRSLLLPLIALVVAEPGSPLRGADHWAFRPVQHVEPPQVRNPRWIRTPPDAFILAQLERAGLEPAPQADRRTLIRRVTFDLTGLPPSADDVDRFLADTEPRAWERLIDRLLDSPHYGERWGRYWLDAARYADTKGYVYGDREESRFVHSHLYRDWVVRAFNEDMPYDQFLKLQIAADQMATPRQNLAALGFLTLGRRFLGVVHDIIDDRIDTLSRATQGLSVSCARCHDHKFDPIPTRDYYSLYGVFSASFDRLMALDPALESQPAQQEFFAGLRKREEALQKTFEKRRNEATERFRRKVKDYVIAVLDVEKLPTEEFYEIRSEDELNPVIVRQWNAHLQRRFQASDAVFLPWRELARLSPEGFREKARGVLIALQSGTPGAANPRVLQALLEPVPSSMKEVAARYGTLLEGVNSTWLALTVPSTNKSTALPSSPAPSALPDPADESLRDVLYGSDSPARVPTGSVNEIEWFFGEGVRVELAKLQKDIEVYLLSRTNAAPYVMAMDDRAQTPLPRVFKRGSPAVKGEEVPRQYLQIIEGPDRKPFMKGSGRLELAESIASPNNPLTARVMANRVWMHHFGSGLVKTPSDFGVRADPPSHPELLDWLAGQFVREGWSVKSLHRLLLLSATYQQRSDALETVGSIASRKDPENRLLWRFNRQRLEFEAMRDALLAASADLDPTPGGPSSSLFTRPFSTRRSLYGYLDRQFIPGVLRLFDVANPDIHTPRRPQTTVPQQALFFMNHRFIHERARALVGRLTPGMESDVHLDQLYRLTLQRRPTDLERGSAREFLSSASALPPAPTPPPGARSWNYGYGELDTNKSRVITFHPLPHFTGEAWQGGEKWPDGKLGWAQLTAEGGHAGNDLKHAVMRRWTPPSSGRYRISGSLAHKHKEGDGIRGYVVAGRAGLLGDWPVHNRQQDISLGPLDLNPNDPLDFVVDYAGGLAYDDFTWRLVIERVGEEVPPGNGEIPVRWDARTDFFGPPDTRLSLSPMEQLAQVLLLSNEFLFVD